MAKKKTKELIKAEPSRTLSSFEEMERRFEDFFRRPFSIFGPSWWPRLRKPEFEEITSAVDIYEESNNVVVKAELPGIKKEDIDLSLTDNTLKISGEKKKEEKVEKKDYFSLERSYGSFTRTFSLPADVQTDKAEAKFKDGVLEIKIPKTEEAIKKAVKVSVK